MRARAFAAAGAVVVIGAAAGIGYAVATSDGSSSPSHESAEQQSPAGALVPAAHPQCAQLGQQIVDYLRTGETRGHPELDQYAASRAELLKEPPAARDGLIRASADDAIQSCDQQLTEQEAQRQQEAQQRQRQAAAQAQAQAAARAEAARQERYTAGCVAHGGAINAYGTCVVSYPNWADQLVTIDDNGNFDQAQADLNRDDCATNQQDATTAAQEGLPWHELPVYHSDTGVCTLGSP